jgi:L-glyceraldehyde 3-phosphate reductase
MKYARCGRSGLLLPAISLGLWHNFGDEADHSLKRKLARTAWDQGITHFDLANNYGPPPGSAEIAFGKILKSDFKAYRDRMVISTKAGYHMWDGPYGEWGSRKYMLASLDQSLMRMGLAYVDIFYSHRFDPDTPLEETMGALDTAVRSGRALYAGISNYDAANTRKAAGILREMGTPCLIHQPKISLLDRAAFDTGVVSACRDEGMGCIAFSALAQGLLTDKYLKAIPKTSRAAKDGFLSPKAITADLRMKLSGLNDMAKARGMTLAQLALSWLLNHEGVTSALIGASKPEQIADCCKAAAAPPFSSAEMADILAAA